MTYVICGLGGSIGKYRKLKSEAHFSEHDIVYALGNLAEGNLSLLVELSMCPNVYPVFGKADRTALRLLEGFEKMIKDGTSPDAKYIAEMKKWTDEGGKETFDSFRSFDKDMKEGLLDFLSEFAPFEEAEIQGKSYILLGGGITGFTPGCDLYELDESAFGTKPLDMEKKYFSDSIIVTGSAKQEYGEITTVGNNICLDCGRPACLRLEDGKKYYI